MRVPVWECEFPTILAVHIDTSTNRIPFNFTSCPKQGVILDTYKKINNIARQFDDT